MNTQSNATPGSPLEPQGVAPAVISPARRFYWSVQRELWENRSIYLAPMIAGAVFLFGFFINTLILRRRMHGAWPLDPAQQHQMFAAPYEIAAVLIMGTAFIVGIFYSLDALYGERRDRSILFWKSLPVSDLTAVLSKLAIPLVFLPLLSFAVSVVTQFLGLLLSTVALLGSGVSVSTLWSESHFFHASGMLFYHILTVHGLWYAPIYGWLLLISAWARRAPFLWAFLPPFVIGGAERIAFNTTYIFDLLMGRVGGPEMSARPPGGAFMTALAVPAQFFIEPGLWIGLAIAAAFLALAVRLRRYRGPI